MDSNVSPYVLTATSIYLLSLIAAFGIGIHALTRDHMPWIMARFLPRRPTDGAIPPRPEFPAARLARVPIGAMLAIGLLAMLPPVGEGDTATNRAMLAAGAGLMTFVALSCWHEAFRTETLDLRATLRTPALWGFLLIALGWNAAFLMGLHLAGIRPALTEGPLLHANLSHPILLTLVLVTALVAALTEEVVFRGVLQPAIGRLAGVVVGIGVSVVCWAFGHLGMVEQPGYKEVQIIGLGLVIAWARHRHGLLAAILLHLANNGLALMMHLVMLLTDRS